LAPLAEKTPGLVASINKAAYVASKHGAIGRTKVAAIETAETGVTVNAAAGGHDDLAAPR
jgi:3-hydroxybutyrate dehydrogenase